MIGVDKIGQIRRAYFEQQRSIKEIVRTLSVSRATVRKVIRSHKTEFKYARGVQPTPKLGDWVEVLTEIIDLVMRRFLPGLAPASGRGRGRGPFAVGDKRNIAAAGPACLATRASSASTARGAFGRPLEN